MFTIQYNQNQLTRNTGAWALTAGIDWCIKEIFTRLHYPEPLVQNTIRSFVEMKVTGNTRLPQQADETPVRIPLPFKDQRSANKLHEQLSDLSRKINTEVHPVFTRCKIKDQLKAKEPTCKPPIVNQQNIVYFFECDLCDADYVSFTSWHLHQHVEEHKRSVISNHAREQHGNEACEIAKNFGVLRSARASSIVWFLRCFLFGTLSQS